jgi:hypothetical protein
MSQLTLVALKSFPYNRATLKVGQSFRAVSVRDAKLLTAIGRAQYDPAELPAVVAVAQAPAPAVESNDDDDDEPTGSDPEDPVLGPIHKQLRKRRNRVNRGRKE